MVGCGSGGKGGLVWWVVVQGGRVGCGLRGLVRGGCNISKQRQPRQPPQVPGRHEGT